MATFKVRVLSATLCLATFGAQLSAVSAAEIAVGTNAAETQPTVLLSTHGATDTGVAQGEVGKELKGGVSKTEVAPEELIDQLVASAYDRDERASEIRAKEGKYRSPLRRSIARVSDMAQFMTAYKGFQASSEAADVILEEKQKLKSKAAVEWIKQKQHDELHPKVVSSLMQIASGLGMSDPVKQQKNVEVGVKQLASIVGDEDAKRALTAMTAWAASIKESSSPTAVQEPINVLKLDSATKKLMESSLQRDEIVLETRSKLQKYNHRSKLLQATAKVVNSTLSVAMFSPTIVSPAAQIALLAFLMATGGPEEAKLLKELYLDRRIECRYKMINQEATQAINNYNVASITGNTVLVQFCNLTANKMGGKDVLAQAVTDEGADAVTSEPMKAVATETTQTVSTESTKAVASETTKAVVSETTKTVATESTKAESTESTKAVVSESTRAEATDSTKAEKKTSGVGMNPPGTSL